jgi:hypothetical protein
MRILQFVITALSFIILVSCNEDIDIAKGYPTTIEEASTIELNKILGQVEQTPMANCVAVNRFGFLFLDYESETCFDIDNWKNDSIKDTILNRTREAFSKYANFFNLPEDDLPLIQSISTHNGISYDDFFKDYPDSLPPVWISTTEIQKYQDIEVRGTGLQVLLSPDEIIGISGHWHSEIIVPSTDNYSAEQSQELLYNQTFTYNRTEILISDNTNWHTPKKIITPITRSGELELHVCWALYPGTWEILVDTQSGEALSAINISAI